MRQFLAASSLALPATVIVDRWFNPNTWEAHALAVLPLAAFLVALKSTRDLDPRLVEFAEFYAGHVELEAREQLRREQTPAEAGTPAAEN